MQLTVRNLNFGYGATPVFSGFSFDCASGDSLWLSGRSGSGKTTLLKLVAGLLKAENGTIRWDDNTISSYDSPTRAEFRKSSIGYGDQELHLVETWTVTQNLRLVSGDGLKISATLRELDLGNFESKRIRFLSGGQKQKVLIARLILQNPEVLLIDEPTAHLDDKNTEIVMEAVNRHFKNKTALIVSHDARVGKWIKSHVSLDGSRS